MVSKLFSPISFKNITLSNRIVLSPMCQYSAENGNANDWHLMNLGQFSVSGAGLVFVEATAVEPVGRITPGDLGLYSDDNERSLERVVQFFRKYGQTKIGIQIAHSGRKGSDSLPWLGLGRPLKKSEGGWETGAPSSIRYHENWPDPLPLDQAMMKRIRNAFLATAKRADRIGFDFLEVHSAHGYLLHEFLSPLTNHRTDEYGGSLQNRLRFPLEVIGEVRNVWPEERPLAVRISATDYFQGGWDIEEAVQYAAEIKKLGVDLIDVSGGGLVPEQKISFGPGYQVPFSDRIRKDANISTMTVGMINDPHQAEEIISTGKADLIAMARGMLYNPRWPWHAAEELKSKVEYPPQYLRCEPSKWPQAFPKNN
jgi:2,4-dienoyl-CoA reductase-like NADH-dependent reductase (Old Yellow Enzyme family)